MRKDIINIDQLLRETGAIDTGELIQRAERLFACSEDCLTMMDILAVARQRKTLSTEEKNHLETCDLCSRLLQQARALPQGDDPLVPFSSQLVQALT